MFIALMTGAYGEEYFGTGETIENAVSDAQDKAGDDVELSKVWEAKEIKVKKIVEYRIFA